MFDDDAAASSVCGVLGPWSLGLMTLSFHPGECEAAM